MSILPPSGRISRSQTTHIKNRILKIMSFEEVQRQPPLKWLVEGILPANSLATLYGRPNVGKTFVSLDLAVAIATGQPWMGHATDPGSVVYVVAEGVGGFPARLNAVATKRQPDRNAVDRIHFIAEAVQLHSQADIEALIAALSSINPPPKLIIFDTLSRCFVGADENSAQDVSRLIESADRVRRDTGATVLLVHHTTKDGNAERGSSALRGAADAMLSISKANNLLHLSCEKEKDAERFKRISFRLISMAGSCVVELSTTTSPVHQEGVSKGALEALKILSKSAGLRWSDWLEAADLTEPTFCRYLNELKEANYVTKDGDLYVSTQQGRAAINSQLSTDAHETPNGAANTTISHSQGP